MPDDTANTSTTQSSEQGNKGAADTTSNVGGSGQSADGTPVGVSAPNTQTNEEANKPAASWRDTLPDDLKNDPTLATLKDVPTLAKSYVEGRKAFGSALQIPTDKSTPEQVDAFYEKIGWVKDSSKITVKGPMLPPGLEMKEEEVTGFRDTAHKLRMTPGQIQGVLDYYGNFVKNVLPDYKGDAEKATQTLSQEWGQATDRNMGVARKALLNRFPKETVDRITQTGLANDVGFIKGMVEIGRSMIEEGLLPEEVGQGMDETSAKSQVAEMESDQKSPLWDKEHPRHAEFVEKRNNLYKIIYGGK